MALHFLGRALLALGRFREAETAFKRRLTLAPTSDMTRFYRACLYALPGTMRKRAAIGARCL
jgi:adenylate cyclase